MIRQRIRVQFKQGALLHKHYLDTDSFPRILTTTQSDIPPPRVAALCRPVLSHVVYRLVYSTKSIMCISFTLRGATRQQNQLRYCARNKPGGVIAAFANGVITPISDLLRVPVQ